MSIYNDEYEAVKRKGMFSVHKNVKLSQDQADIIEHSGETDSQYIRNAVELRQQIDAGNKPSH